MTKDSAVILARISAEWAVEVLKGENHLHRKELNEALGHLEGAALLIRSALSEEL